MLSIKELFKKEAVAFIAAAAALVSCLLVPVTNYVEYIDTELIGVLFGLMTAVAGFSENNVFNRLARITVKHARNSRLLTLALVLTVFFSSMLITNDVALIVFVPFTVMLCSRLGISSLYMIVLETVAANMGSALTPIGSPQNLYLFSASKMTAAEFFSITAPITAVSLLLLTAAALISKKEPVFYEPDEADERIKNPKYLVLYSILFLLCILSVFGIVDTIYVFASVCVVTAIIQPHIFTRVDYGLLVTFACFFIFIGNIRNIPEVTELVSNAISGREFESALLLSQIISNVPAAVMLSAFTTNHTALILGTDIGGLGTIIASLASLIAYKNYMRSENARTRDFLLVFTPVNLVFLLLLYVFARVFIL